MTDTRLGRRKIRNYRTVPDARLEARIHALEPVARSWGKTEESRIARRNAALRSGFRDVLVQGTATAVGTGFTVAASFVIGQWVGVFEENGAFVGAMVGVIALLLLGWVSSIWFLVRVPSKVAQYQDAVLEQNRRHLRAKLDRGEELTEEERKIYASLPYK